MTNMYMHTFVCAVGRATPLGVILLGTCFFIQEGLFVTTAHVTNYDDTDLVIMPPPITDLYQYQDTSEEQVGGTYAKIHSIDPIRDIAILKVENRVNNNVIRITSTDTLPIGTNLTIMGYPHCDTGRRVLTFQSTIVGAKVLIETSGIKSKHLILNIQTRPGQSGSPVFSGVTGQLVAMIIGSYAPRAKVSITVSGVDPRTLHQTTHAISSEYILKMI